METYYKYKLILIIFMTMVLIELYSIESIVMENSTICNVL